MRLSNIITSAQNIAQGKLEVVWDVMKAGQSLAEIPSVAAFLGNGAQKTLGDVHAFVGREITYQPEPEGEDHWQTPRETFDKGKGDCEDIALSYLAVGLLCGMIRTWSIDVVWDVDQGLYHAVLVVDEMMVLDNKSTRVVALSAHRQFFPPVVRLRIAKTGGDDAPST